MCGQGTAIALPTLELNAAAQATIRETAMAKEGKTAAEAAADAKQALGASTMTIDYEGELAIVIGHRPVRNISPAEAMEYVAGLSAANDVSHRFWQRRNTGSFGFGKGFDNFCPLGPCLATLPALMKGAVGGGGGGGRGPVLDLKLETRVNGQTVQSSTTSDMIFTVGEVVSHLSTDRTLLPGTVIITGTPSGVGAYRTPPLWLKAGDTVEIEIEGIGTLSNPVTAVPPSARL